MSFETWFVFLITEMILSLSPGPAVFYVVAQSLRSRGLMPIVAAASGVIVANGFYFMLSATSLGALIAASGAFFNVVKWAGAAYLVYLGVRALRDSKTAGAVDATTGKPVGRSSARVFTGALSLQLANPKALLFFLALLPQFIDPKLAIAPQMIILALTSMLPEFFILLGYGWLASRAGHLVVGQRANRWLARAEGVGLLGCAAMVAAIKRTAP